MALLEKEQLAKRRLEALSRANERLRNQSKVSSKSNDQDLASKLKIDRLTAKRRSQLRTSLRPFLSRASQLSKKSDNKDISPELQELNVDVSRVT